VLVASPARPLRALPPDALAADLRREHPGVDVSTLPPLVRLARLVDLGDAFQRTVLAPFSLAVGDYMVLSALRRAGPARELTPSQLCGRLERSSGGMTKILKRLEEQGLVRRAPDPDDGRGSRVALTAAGLKTQQRVFEAFLSASRDLLDPLPAAQRREVDRALRTLVDAFETFLPA
jgi:DNA-binding MarR family transcriptional regulator